MSARDEVANFGYAKPKQKLTAPSWVTEWHAADPVGTRAVIARFNAPVTDAHERAAAAAFVRDPSYACASCGRFAFARAAVLCFWCARRVRAQGSPID